MGISIVSMHGYYEFAKGRFLPERPRQVFSLAEKALMPFIELRQIPANLSHIVVSTTCPDMLAPSLGQMINEKYNSIFSDCHTIDIVQGCAGGVTAMILGSQLAEMYKSSVIVLQADAAKKATSVSDTINEIFGNGSFACIIRHEESKKKMIHYKSRQYVGLSEVVTVKLGHDADEIIKHERTDMALDPRKHLGLTMNNTLALRLVKNAENFYLEFVSESTQPDIMILHQVNPVILSHLKEVFSKYSIDFVDVVNETGNCGAASVGIALNKIKDRIENKKVFLCSFGTGGVITAGLWQN